MKKTFTGFIKWKGSITKLMRSAIDLWVPPQYLSWLGLNNTYTPNTRKCSLLCYTVPHAIPSLLVLFRVCIEYLLAPLDLSMRFLSSLGFSIQFLTFSTPKSFKPTPRFIEQQHTNVGYMQNVPRSQKRKC